MRKILIIITITLFVASCGSSKKTTQTYQQPKKELPVVKSTDKKVNTEIDKLEKRSSELDRRTIAYISHYAPIAMEEMKKHKIPASITLAQGILESGNGMSNLALKSNNHFGIKCHKGWNGPSVRHDDDKKQECFRKYKYPENSYRDHSEFLTTRSRYAFLFDLKKDDYKGWAKGLKKAGYATDKKYPDKLIHLIETYNLDHYDKIAKNKKVLETVERQPKKRPGKSYKVRKGDTLYSIAKRYRMSVAEIKELNELSDNTIGIGQVLILE